MRLAIHLCGNQATSRPSYIFIYHVGCKNEQRSASRAFIYLTQTNFAIASGFRFFYSFYFLLSLSQLRPESH